MKLEHSFDDGFPHIWIEAEDDLGRAFLTMFVHTISRDEHLTAFYWPLLDITYIGQDPKEMNLAEHHDWHTRDEKRGEHSAATVSRIDFRTICPNYEMENADLIEWLDKTIKVCKNTQNLVRKSHTKNKNQP